MNRKIFSRGVFGTSMLFALMGTELESEEGHGE